MQRLRLAEDLETGLSDVDEQHAALFEWGNRVLFPEGGKLQPREVLEILQLLDGYVKYHFAAEEKAMQRSDYPNLRQHQALHKKLTDELDAIRHQCNVGSFSGKLRARLHFMMSDWLTYHIGSADKAFAAFAREKGIAAEVELEDMEGLNISGITEADLAQVSVVKPEGQVSGAEATARSRRWR